ncbi:MAG: hypothetical protein ISR72_12835, partial [Methylobacter sp.]|nr:hypothetical protein [Methylobacter sp.]
KELARGLEKRTAGLLVGKVEQSSEGSDFLLEFYIAAPSLNNYEYKVLDLTHNLNFYPLHISSSNENSFSDISNQEDLEISLKTIFSSAEVKRVINGLLAQIKSTN